MLAWFQTSALALVIGFGLGVGALTAWHEFAPFGLGLAQKLDAAELDASENRMRYEACNATLAQTVAEWSAAVRRLEAARKADLDAAAAELAKRSASQIEQNRAAFDAGFIAGRALAGGKSDACVKTGGDGRRDHAASDGVSDDLRDAWRAGSVGTRADP